MCLPNAKRVFKVEREWEHAGLNCAVVQGREGGNRCGYVRVPPSHPFHGKGYTDLDDINVHGGLTFASIEPCAHDDGVGYWFGFDCAHSGDAHYDPDNLPQHEKDFRIKYPEFNGLDFDEHFWSHEEVVRETEYLARQLSRVATETASNKS